MKRLALLLAAMGVISVGAMAEAPALKVTNIGQSIEIDNTSGGEDIGETVYFFNTLGLSYGDWNFGLTGAKLWSADTVTGVKSKDARLQLDAWKKIDDNLKLGARYRGQSKYDRYYLRYAYKNGAFYSNGDFWYNSQNSKGNTDNDAFEVEAWPLGLKYDNFRAAWYVRGTVNQGTIAEGAQENSLEHQARFYWDFYKGEKLGLSAEYRITLNQDVKYKGDQANGALTKYKAFGRNQAVLSATYAVTESLDISGYYLYDIKNDNEYIATGEKCESGKYYGEFSIGWNYKF